MKNFIPNSVQLHSKIRCIKNCKRLALKKDDVFRVFYINYDRTYLVIKGNKMIKVKDFDEYFITVYEKKQPIVLSKNISDEHFIHYKIDSNYVVDVNLSKDVIESSLISYSNIQVSKLRNKEFESLKIKNLEIFIQWANDTFEIPRFISKYNLNNWQGMVFLYMLEDKRFSFEMGDDIYNVLVEFDSEDELFSYDNNVVYGHKEDLTYKEYIIRYLALHSQS